MENVHIVCGPTSTGKTKFAIELAREVDGELINFDSRQVYKYLDIGTNKGNLLIKNYQLSINNYELPIYQIQNQVIHLVSFLELDGEFSVYEFQKLGFKLIENILSRGKVPILVGGTGLYMDSLIKRYSLVKNERDGSLHMLDLSALQERLKSKNKRTFKNLNNSDKNNPVRLRRLIEKSGKVDISVNESLPQYEYEIYYPKYDWDDLKATIEDRIENMFKIGFIDEVKSILEMGFGKNLPILKTMGYREVIRYLDNEIDLDTCKSLIAKSHIQYAKRQRTWFEGKGRKYSFTFF